MNVTIGALNNDAPVISEGAGPLALSVDEDVAKAGSISATDPDTADTDLTYSVLADGDHGEVTGLDINDGTYLYTPDPDFDGTDTFTLQVSDGHGGTDTVVVNVTVNNVNLAPVIDEANSDVAPLFAISSTVTSKPMILRATT